MDLPKGKTIWLFDQTDMARAKQTIGQVACIEGNVPLSLIYAGTAEETAAYVAHLIDVAGKGGGYILDIGAVADAGKDENLRAMIDTAQGVRPVLMESRRRYGVGSSAGGDRLEVADDGEYST